MKGTAILIGGPLAGRLVEMSGAIYDRGFIELVERPVPKFEMLDGVEPIGSFATLHRYLRVGGLEANGVVGFKFNELSDAAVIYELLGRYRPDVTR